MILIVLFLLFVVNTSGTTYTLFTTFGVAGHQQIGTDGDMFDLCAKTNVEITSFGIHCYCDNVAYSVTTQIYVATAIDQPYFDIKTSSTKWTLIHNEVINCAGLESLTDLSTFNRNSVPIIIKDNDCRGFYVAFTTDNQCWLSNTAYASNSEGTVYVSDSAIEIKVGGGMYYPFDDPDFTRLWNGQLHYNIPTVSPTNNPTKTPTQYPTAVPTNKPTVDPTMTPTNEPTNIPTNDPTHDPITPTNEPTNIPTNEPTHDPITPTNDPSIAPTNLPSPSPTLMPSKSPVVIIIEKEGTYGIVYIIIGVLLTLIIGGLIFLTKRCLKKRNHGEQLIYHDGNEGKEENVQIEPMRINTMSDVEGNNVLVTEYNE